MKVALLLDGASAYAANPDRLIIGTAEDIERSLVAEGNTVTWIPVYQDGKWIDKVRRGKFDLAFNMCEGIDGIATLESSVISVLELFKVPFTGASSYTTAICLRKPVINAILEKAGLISHGRGTITVVDRGGLEKAACECYRTVRDREANLIS